MAKYREMSENGKKHIARAMLLPWVSELAEPRSCDGWTGSRMRSRKDLVRGYKHYGCRVPARWRYESPVIDNDESPTTGNYCFHHIYSRGISGSNHDHAHNEKWYIEHGHKRERVFGDGVRRTVWEDDDESEFAETDFRLFRENVTRAELYESIARTYSVRDFREKIAQARSYCSNIAETFKETDNDVLISICRLCGNLIAWIDCPTGGWWSHHKHPSDDHDAISIKEVLFSETSDGLEIRTGYQIAPLK